MSKSDKVIVFIYEGEDDEKRILESIKKHFFPKKDGSKYIFLPFKTDVYTLWKEVKEEDEFLDVVAVLKGRDEQNRMILETVNTDNISEIYLFFDYDGHARFHQGDGNDIVREMLATFNNETELGKLYISYPMVETYKDLITNNVCSRNCCVSAIANEGYKELFAKESIFNNLAKFDSNSWFFISYHNMCKANCICCDSYDFPGYESYLKNLDQENIFHMQMQKFISNDEVATISGFPFFISDYFGEKLYSKLDKFSLKYSATKITQCTNKK